MSPMKMDLHMHSDHSDGGDAPGVVVEKAQQAGVTLMALTDHDTVTGVGQAVKAGLERDITVLPAVEMDTQWPSELHILGLDIDIQEPRLAGMLELARQRRIARNEVIFQRLKEAGYDLEPYLTRSVGSTTRLHIALALVAGGFAETISDAFDRYLRRGCPGFYTVERFTPEQVVAGILGAGGVPVWAHPFHGGQSVHKMLEMLKSIGILGLEAYHPSASQGESEILVSLARQNGLLVTCGSDSHGSNRPGVSLGCTWRDTPELMESYEFFMERAGQPE